MRISKNPAFLILFIVSSLIQLLYPTDIIEVLPFIICAIAAGLIIYTDITTLKRAIFIIYVMICSLESNYLTFLPVVMYAFYDHQDRLWSLLAMIPFLMMVTTLIDVQSKIFIACVFTVMAILFKMQHLANIKLKKDLTETSDTMRELTIHLNEQNRLLMAHQDDEIHVATLKERNRIAREIHDHVGHQLSRVLLQIGAQLTLNKTDPALLSMKDTLDSAMDNLRKSVHDLHETSMELETQLSQVVDQFDFCPVKVNIHLDNVVNPQIKVAIVAILKESFSNISKHSKATEVKVSLIEHPGFYQFIISDNGTIPNLTQNQFFNSGIGLKNIEQRVTELKGHFLIRNQNGFELFITLPKL
ncbi:histidine kinase [Fusibacter bizertensis]|uniref:histidine kinase n=1 Tax=Fusibacter bizertensis TaxID=1488331 RepID=A0ABT6N995_9FIRM|nr:histidine kinase [Fusibacter bizertensis]MDH8676990.1 histidine kinase [Fusibacter bizertensis]